MSFITEYLEGKGFVEDSSGRPVPGAGIPYILYVFPGSSFYFTVNLNGDDNDVLTLFDRKNPRGYLLYFLFDGVDECRQVTYDNGSGVTTLRLPSYHAHKWWRMVVDAAADPTMVPGLAGIKWATPLVEAVLK